MRHSVEPVEPPPEFGRETPELPAETEEILATSGLALPNLHAGASASERGFHDRALRAVVRTYVSDVEDPSLLLSLYEKMLTDEGLSYLAEDWRTPLELAIVRAETLQRVNAPLRALHRAYERATAGDQPGLYAGIDHRDCRSAFAELRNLDSDALEIYVTVPPVGRHALRDVESICIESDAAELASREFPEPQGSRRLRRLVRKAYNRAYQGSGKKVRRVVVPDDGWEELPDQEQRVLRAIVGVQRKQAFPQAPCVMEEITIAQKERKKKGRGRYGRPICCQIKNTVAISCDQLKE